MSISLRSTFYQLPSVQQFLNTLATDLADRRSVFVLLPIGVDPTEVWSMLRGELWRRDFGFEEISLPNLPESHVPAVALGNVLRVRWPAPEAPRTIAHLITAENLPDVVQLGGLDQLPASAREAWTSFVVQWAQASQNVADRGKEPTALCVLVPAPVMLPSMPESSVYLTVRWWWGFPSTLEMRLLCRLSNQSGDRDSVAQWREYVLPALAGNDVSLMEYLWDELALFEESDLVFWLHSFAEQRGWSAAALQRWGSGELFTGSSRNPGHLALAPPPPLRTLWAHGTLGWTPEYGLELHTAALAALGQDQELNHRLWRGQAELLLPLVDHVRLSLCAHLTRLYGHDWPLRWHQPESLEERAALRRSPLACQWGYLEWLLKNCIPLRAERRWLPLVSLARWIRNAMAHYRPVTFHDFDGLQHEMKRLSSFPFPPLEELPGDQGRASHLLT